MSELTAVEASRPDVTPEASTASVDPATPVSSVDADDPGSRGSLVVRDRIVERIAEAAVLEVEGVVRHSGGLDRVTGHDLPDVDVVVAGARVRASLAVAVVWGVSLADVAARARDAVTDALGRMAGMTVDAVDVRIAHVSTDIPSRRRVQ